VDADVEGFTDEVVRNQISRYVLCSTLGEKGYQFYANQKDLKLAFNHYLDEIEKEETSRRK